MLSVREALKLSPVIVTDVPISPDEGKNEVMTGGGGEVKLKPVNAPVPPAVVTLTSPVEPPPTTAVIVLGETTVNEVADVPPKLTDVAPLRFVPIIVTVVPLPVVVGVKEVIVGVGM